MYSLALPSFLKTVLDMTPLACGARSCHHFSEISVSFASKPGLTRMVPTVPYTGHLLWTQRLIVYAFRASGEGSERRRSALALLWTDGRLSSRLSNSVSHVSRSYKRSQQPSRSRLSPYFPPPRSETKRIHAHTRVSVAFSPNESMTPAYSRIPMMIAGESSRQITGNQSQSVSRASRFLRSMKERPGAPAVTLQRSD